MGMSNIYGDLAMAVVKLMGRNEFERLPIQQGSKYNASLRVL